MGEGEPQGARPHPGRAGAGLPIVLISHNMPHVFDVAARIHIHRLGRRLVVIDPRDHVMYDAAAFTTGAKAPPKEAQVA